MVEPIKGCSFNVCLTSDNKLLLEWQKVDPVNGRASAFRTVHQDFEDLTKTVKQVLTRASVLQ